MDIKLRPLSKDVVEILRAWRNKNRKYFVWQGVISREMQQKWYEKYKKDPTDTIYIVYYSGDPVGAIGTTKRGEDIEIGRVMLGEKRYARRGIMGQATETLISQFPKGKRIFLEVIKNNKLAINFYKKHNFKIMGEDRQRNTYIMERWV